MSGTLDLCEKYFQTRDLYSLLDIAKESLEKDIKKAYYKLSLKVHPDRVSEKDKEVATEKFKILAKVHEVLTDRSRRALYDEKGIVDDDDDENLTSWLELWKELFKPITTEDIDNYQKQYVGSDLERADIKKSYLNGKGCINYMFNCVPFIQVEDEPRLQNIVKEMIDAKEVPEYKCFTHEPAEKRKRRHKKYAREKVEAEEIKKKLKFKENGNSLEQQLMKRQQDRESNFNSLMDKLLEKYGNDEGKEIDLAHIGKKKKSKKNTPRKGKQHLVQNGKVKKKE